ncbi:BamA/TamA family outer membrane protein [Pendulispora albinea]|uniref:BamA/TamA family outer membrane protein n=1 Tax=Pendulispora albinea TaxID=2741071 RepID=A0ABZ2MBG3_9BACT
MLKWLAGLLVLASSGMARAAPPSSASAPSAPAPSEKPAAEKPAAEKPAAEKPASEKPASKDEPPPRRYEFLPVPDLGGNSDIGVELGVDFTLARFYDDARPYKWLFSGALSTSFKSDAEDGLRMVQQYHSFRLDVPNLFGGRVRVDSRVSFTRNITARYHGLGNASTVDDLPLGDEPSRRNQYIAENVRLRSLVRVKTGTPFDAAFAAHLRYEFPTVYEGSKLAYDTRNNGIIGTENAVLGGLAVGAILDTRDNEFVPHQGVFYQMGVLGMVGSAERIAYGEASAVLSSYIPIGRFMTFASRIAGSFQFGRVPFYDLHEGGVFNRQPMLGGERGGRGVPEARYAGHAKIIANYELRTTFIPAIHVIGRKLQIGTTTFLDAGRVWNNFDSSASDGPTPGIKYGFGGGFFFVWDRSSVFRVEIAHSPSDHDPSEFPLAYYIANGLTF